MIKRMILTQISLGLHKEILKEKAKLKQREKNKQKIKKKRITMYDASQSILRKCLR